MYKIVLIDFDFTDVNKSKLRPALILTNSNKYEDFIVAAITSKIPTNPEKGDVILKSDDKNFYKTGLEVTSLIKLTKIATVNSRRIKGELGVLPKGHENKVQKGIKSVFSLR